MNISPSVAVSGLALGGVAAVGSARRLASAALDVDVGGGVVAGGAPRRRAGGQQAASATASDGGPRAGGERTANGTRGLLGTGAGAAAALRILQASRIRRGQRFATTARVPTTRTTRTGRRRGSPVRTRPPLGRARRGVSPSPRRRPRAASAACLFAFVRVRPPTDPRGLRSTVPRVSRPTPMPSSQTSLAMARPVLGGGEAAGLPHARRPQVEPEQSAGEGGQRGAGDGGRARTGSAGARRCRSRGRQALRELLRRRPSSGRGRCRRRSRAGRPRCPRRRRACRGRC